jgi:hypothetical protein
MLNKTASLKKRLEKQKQEFENKQKDYESKKGVLEVIADLEKKKETLNTQLEEKGGAVIAKGKDIEKSEEESKILTA